MKLLLDTCTFLWLASDAPRLSPKTRELMLDPTIEAYVSSVSAWEIAIKHLLGQLRLPETPQRFIPEVRGKLQIEPLPLEEEAALYVGRLPTLHRDPFDRMLICQAIVHGLVLVTPDPLITQYPVRTIW